MCVQPETKDGPCLLKAMGEHGEVGFVAIVAFSKQYPESRSNHAALFDLGIAAFFSQIRSLPLGADYFTGLKRGETIPLEQGTRALQILRSSGIGDYVFPPPCRRWINVMGEPISEPQDFFPNHLAASMCSLSGRIHFEYGSVEDGLKDLQEFCVKSFGRVTGEDFDFMMEWRELLESASRTVNHHIDTKDYSPNMSKIAKFFAFYNTMQQRIDRLLGVDSFAEHLRDRSLELCTARVNNWKTPIGMVEQFRRARFPGDRHV